MSAAPVFAVADIPVVDIDDAFMTALDPDPDPAPTDLACETCNTPLSYAGRGRRPRFCAEHRRSSGTPRPTSSRGAARTAGVEDALARMDMLYGLLAAGLMMVNPVAASEFAGRVEGTQLLNRQAFEADPRLVKRINTTSQNAGTLLFIGSNVMLIGPTARAMYETVATQAQARKAAAASESPSPFEDFGTPA